MLRLAPACCKVQNGKCLLAVAPHHKLGRDRRRDARQHLPALTAAAAAAIPAAAATTLGHRHRHEPVAAGAAAAHGRAVHLAQRLCRFEDSQVGQLGAVARLLRMCMFACVCV